MLIPWHGRNLDKWQDSYNYHLSRCRQCIERAFGMLVKRFGVFWRKLITSFKTWPLIATVAAKLHNLCIDKKIPSLNRVDRDIQVGDIELVLLNDQGRLDGQNHARGRRRLLITKSFEDIGRPRPQLVRRRRR